jgi:hypothetical protein
LALRRAAETGKLATDNVAIANVSTMDRRDIMLISRFLSAKIKREVRRAVVWLNQHNDMVVRSNGYHLRMAEVRVTHGKSRL